MNVQQRQIHGLKIKIGLRTKWMKMCEKRGATGQVEICKKDIERYKQQILARS